MLSQRPSTIGVIGKPAERINKTKRCPQLSGTIYYILLVSELLEGSFVSHIIWQLSKPDGTGPPPSPHCALILFREWA